MEISNIPAWPIMFVFWTKGMILQYTKKKYTLDLINFFMATGSTYLFHVALSISVNLYIFFYF